MNRRYVSVNDFSAAGSTSTRCDLVGEIVAGRAVDGPVLRGGAPSPLRIFSTSEVQAAVGGLEVKNFGVTGLELFEIIARVPETVDVVDAQAGHRAGPDQFKDETMGGFEDLGRSMRMAARVLMSKNRR